MPGRWLRAEPRCAALCTIAPRLVVAFFATVDASAPGSRDPLGRLHGIMVTDRVSQFGFWDGQAAGLLQDEEFATWWSGGSAD